MGHPITARLRKESGQSLVEVLIALFFLAIAVAAVISLMTAGALSLQRAGERGTANTLADKQLEYFRTIAYKYIRLDHTATFNSFYTGASASDSSIPAANSCSTAGQLTPLCLVTDATPGETSCSSGPACVAPVQTVTGPDSRRYEIDTYISFDQPSSKTTAAGTQAGRTLKSVIVIIRDGQSSSEPILARNGSTFDQATSATG